MSYSRGKNSLVIIGTYLDHNKVKVGILDYNSKVTHLNMCERVVSNIRPYEMNFMFDSSHLTTCSATVYSKQHLMYCLQHIQR